MNSVEKKAFANEAEKVFAEPLMAEVMAEFAGNMGFALAGLPNYGLRKVALYAATIARANALGIPLSDLRTTPEEDFERQSRLAEVADVVIVVAPTEAQKEGRG